MLLDGTAAGTASGTSHTLTGLTPATTYTVGLKAVDASGNAAAYPATATLTTGPGYDHAVPSWPPHSRLRVSGVTGTNATLAWPAASPTTSVSPATAFW